MKKLIAAIILLSGYSLHFFGCSYKLYSYSINPEYLEYDSMKCYFNLNRVFYSEIEKNYLPQKYLKETGDIENAPFMFSLVYVYSDGVIQENRYPKFDKIELKWNDHSIDAINHIYSDTVIPKSNNIRFNRRVIRHGPFEISGKIPDTINIDLEYSYKSIKVDSESGRHHQKIRAILKEDTRSHVRDFVDGR